MSGGHEVTLPDDHSGVGIQRKTRTLHVASQTKAKTRRVAKRTSEGTVEQCPKPSPAKVNPSKVTVPQEPTSLDDLVSRKFASVESAKEALRTALDGVNKGESTVQDANVIREYQAAYTASEQDLQTSLYWVAKTVDSTAKHSPNADSMDDSSGDETLCTQECPKAISTCKPIHTVTVDLKASLRRRVEKKKRKLADIKDSSVVKMASLDSFFKNNNKDDNKEELNMYRDLMAKVRPEQKTASNRTSCPLCTVSSILEERERPPSKVCLVCGYTIELWDASETDSTQLVGYRAKQHFMALVNRVRVKVKHKISDDIYDAVYLELDKMGVQDVSQVTVNMVDTILRNLSRKVDQRFTHYYAHVYQITNKIRGAPIIVVTEDQVRQLDSLFDLAHDTWKLIKKKDRLNFLANSFVLRMFFGILGFPNNIIDMVSIIKGVENIRAYNVVCQQICDVHGWNYTPVSDIQSVRNGSLASLPSVPQETTKPNPMDQDQGSGVGVYATHNNHTSAASHTPYVSAVPDTVRAIPVKTHTPTSKRNMFFPSWA